MSAILYENAGRNVVLIDIPKSIEAAQDRLGSLLSVPSLDVPIKSQHGHQPASLTAKGCRVDNADSAESPGLYAEYRTLINDALVEISSNVTGTWCRPRKILTQYLGHDGHGQVEDPEADVIRCKLREWAAGSENEVDSNAFQLQSLMESLAVPNQVEDTSGSSGHQWTMSYRPAYGDPTAQTIPENNSKQPFTCVFHNPEKVSLRLTVSPPTQLAQSGQEYCFTIPPRSTLSLSDVTQSHVFRASLRDITNEFALRRHFDLVLLDPPWPNRSAKRKKGTYEQVGGMPRIIKLLLKMDIDSYLEHNALVGIWITNKDSLRDHVLGPGGLFDAWNVVLIEEWIWIKTTSKGEPMLDIDDPMRKPYEVLLLARAAPTSWTTMQPPPVKRRVIAAVPDVHSRKPCLKALFEAYMTLPSDYRALEVFARHLVTGWTSWGNEVLLYQHDRYWTAADL